MAKQLVSIVLHKKQKKPISKRRKLKTALNKIINFMKSDNYMFAPLLHPQPDIASHSSASSVAGEISREPTMKFWKNGKKLRLEDVEEYLKCDCYMYAPLIAADSASDNHATSPREDPTEEAPKQDGNKNLSSSGDINDNEDGSYNPRKRIAVRHMQLRREKVKHVIHQNCCPSSTVSEKMLSQKQPRDITLE